MKLAVIHCVKQIAALENQSGRDPAQRQPDKLLDVPFAARAGIDLLLEVGVGRLGAHAEGLATRCIDGLLERGADVVTPRDPAQRAGVIVARHPDPQRLFDFCRGRGVDIGAIGGVRVDPAGFNTAADIDRFLDCYDELSF